MKQKNIFLIIISLIVMLCISSINNEDNKDLYITKNINKKENDKFAFYIQEAEGSDNYTNSKTIPSQDDGYQFAKYVCNDETIIKFNSAKWLVNLSNLQSGSTKCSLYFDIDTATARKYILAQNNVNDTTPDFSTSATTNEGIFTAEDDEGTSYYYRGAVTNNYFYFGGYYWRIVRINGDGTIRLIYHGEVANATGTNAQLSTTYAWNTSSNDNAYVGYMYGSAGSTTYDETHQNINNSVMKTGTDSWYESNLANYANYIDNNAGFCGDRSLTSGTGIGTNQTFYGSYGRIVTNKTPSLKCISSNDLYTTNNSEKGNKKLTYPIGHITADEVAMAGGVSTGTSGTTNKNYYLYTGTNWRTISPYGYDVNSGTYYATVFGVDTSGVIRRFYKTTGEYGVKPVINIRKDVELTGTGTSSDPYKIVEPGKSIQEIIANKTISTRSDFSTIVTEDTTGIIYSAEDDDGTSYYFAGAPTDNWVKFAGYYWRIIRINGDGTIRLIYNGTSATKTGEETHIGSSEFNPSYTDNAYVGYMYTIGSLRGLGTSSTIKGVLDSWYDSNLTSYVNYIDPNAGFCGDRTPSTSESSSNGSGGIETIYTYYAPYIRRYSTHEPTLKCENSSDLYTVSGASKGNKALTYPIGLITMDEVGYAGADMSAYTNNSNYYLYTAQDYWTMSPHRYHGGAAYMFLVASDHGYLGLDTVDYSYGVRPVINLRSDVTLTGTGTSTNPYEVSLK